MPNDVNENGNGDDGTKTPPKNFFDRKRNYCVRPNNEANRDGILCAEKLPRLLQQVCCSKSHVCTHSRLHGLTSPTTHSGLLCHPTSRLHRRRPSIWNA